MSRLFLDKVDSALGQISLVSDGVPMCLRFRRPRDANDDRPKKRFGSFDLDDCTNPQGFSDRLRLYLEGNLTSLQSIPVNPGGTPFQQQVWSALRSIPVGTVITYANLATQVSKPTAYRTVGMANGQNPIAIVIPCQRVIGSNSQLTGCSGGLQRKHWLLKHEGVALEATLPLLQ